MSEPVAHAESPARQRVAILISGGGSNMVKLVEALQERPDLATPALVLSNVPDAGGLQKAEALGVSTCTIDHRAYRGDRSGFEAELTKALDAAAADVVCLAGFMRILTPPFVAHFAGRILNIHPSLLPKYKGLHTHARAIKAGDREHGCTVHLVTPELDDGPILGQATVPILPGDTADALAARVLPMEHRLYPQVLMRYLEGIRAPVLLR